MEVYTFHLFFIKCQLGIVTILATVARWHTLFSIFAATSDNLGYSRLVTIDVCFAEEKLVLCRCHIYLHRFAFYVILLQLVTVVVLCSGTQMITT